jgi:hypothetical protein
MLDWILEKLPVVIFVVIFLGQVFRGFVKMRGSRNEPPPPRHNDVEEERRAQEIQQEIRRKIAERRGGHSVPPELPPSGENAPQRPVVVARDPTAIPVPEPLRRMLDQLERRVQTPPTPPPVPHRAAEVERQEQLAEQLRVLEETRVLTARRAAKIVAKDVAEQQSERGLRKTARGKLNDELRDPESLRRAMVLREVLGTPVGLR